MSKLLKSIEKKIEIDKEIINVLPKTGIKQIKDLKKKIETMLDKYNKMDASIIKEMNRRYDNITSIKENPEIAVVKKQILEWNNLGLSDDAQNAFEKMGLDKLLYNLNGYYKKDLGTINKDIIRCVKKFKEVGIQLTKKDFNISEYVSEYMSVLLEEASKGVTNSEIIKNAFEKVYWKCSDLIPHIIVNIRQIYDKHEEEIELFYKNKTEKILSELNLTKEQLEAKKQELVEKLDSLVNLDGRNILDSFFNNTYSVSDYKRENYDKTYEKIISKNPDELTKEEKADMDINISDLHNNLVEYVNYLEFKFLIDEILKLREEKLKEVAKEQEEKANANKKDKKGKKDKNGKNTQKSEYETLKLEIKTLFDDIEKINGTHVEEKPKFGFFKKKEEQIINKNDPAKILERDKKILSIKDLYAKIDICRQKEVIFANVNDTSKLLDLLRLASYNYGFLARTIIKQYPDIIENDIHSMIERIRKFVRLYNFSVINNINMLEKKDISIVIKDKYKLLGMALTKENFSEAGIDELIKDIQLIKSYNDIVRSNILLEDIQYVINAKEILKR